MLAFQSSHEVLPLAEAFPDHPTSDGPGQNSHGSLGFHASLEVLSHRRCSVFTNQKVKLTKKGLWFTFSL